MPKTYFCTKIYNSETCGERDPKEFPTGRYSTCKRCRSKLNNDTIKLKKNTESESKADNIDPDMNFRYLIEDTIRRFPMIKGRTIEDSIHIVDTLCSDLITSNYDFMEKLKLSVQIEFKKMNDKISSLENELIEMKKI